MELEEKQDVFRSLQDTAELLSLENHPAKQTVEVCGFGECVRTKCSEMAVIKVFISDFVLLKDVEEESGIICLVSFLFSSNLLNTANSFDSLRKILQETKETLIPNFMGKVTLTIFFQITTQTDPASCWYGAFAQRRETVAESRRDLFCLGFADQIIELPLSVKEAFSM